MGVTTTRDVGVIGTGLWNGEVVTNDQLTVAPPTEAQVRDPYMGRRDASGAIRIAGMTLGPERYPRTLAAIDRAFRDPFRGARRRRYFPREMRVSDAETEAARNAIADAGLTPADVDLILVQSFLPDEMQPKNAALIAHNLGIRHAPAWELDSICNSTVTHLMVGSAMIAAQQARHVVCVHSCAYSRVSDPGSSSAVQEADMAAAFVLGPSPGTQMAFAWRTDGRLHGAIKLRWDTPAGSATRRYWERSQEQFLVRFDMALQEQVMSEIADNGLLVCRAALERAELRVEDLDAFIPHQPMAWYGAFMEDVLGLRDGVLVDTFAEYSSINSVSMAATIHDARRAGRLPRGSRVLMYGPGAGYTFGAAAIRW